MLKHFVEYDALEGLHIVSDFKDRIGWDLPNYFSRIFVSHCHHYTVGDLVDTKIKVTGFYFHLNIE